MIIVTGGAGFIGSVVVWELNQRGIKDIIVVDHLGTSEKWRNLVPLRFTEYFDKEVFIDKLERGFFGSSVDAVIHLGACSSTTERDADYLMQNNVYYTKRIAQWWEKQQNVRFIYASSAATYGDGAQGYSDDHVSIYALRPLNMYGYSKQLFDCMALEKGWLDNAVGLKFFNVFGPNENHKGDMRSVINKAYPQVRSEGVMRLFKSYKEGYGDGEQKRDFIYVKDAVSMALWFLDNSHGGIYNVGTGVAHTWNDMASGIFAALGKERKIEYIPMPQELQSKYQYFTEANMKKLQSCGYSKPCYSFDDAIREYINEYLSCNKVLGE